MICKICNKEFPKLGYHLKSHNLTSKQYYNMYFEKGKCEFCGKPAKFLNLNKGYSRFCSTACANKFNAPIISQKALNRTSEENRAIAQKARNTRKLHFGDETYGLFGSKRHQEAIKEKYNVDYISQAIEIKEKSKLTCLKRYGCEYSFQSDNNKQKTKETLCKKYGVDNAYKIESVKQNSHSAEAEKKRQLTMQVKMSEIARKRSESLKITWKNKSIEEKQAIINKLTNLAHTQSLKFALEHNCTQRVTLIKEFGQGWLSLKIPQIYDEHSNAYVDNCYLPTIKEYANSYHNSYASKKEKELLNFIKSIYNGAIIENSKLVIPPYEVDIFLPDLNIAFEFNGTFWHSELQKDKFYHFIKSMKCKEKGIRLVHIYEWEWDSSKQFVRDVIFDNIKLDTSEIVKVDFNKSNGQEYENLGYSLIEIITPNIWYWKDNIVSDRETDDYKARIFGSGFLIYKKGGISDE